MSSSLPNKWSIRKPLPGIAGIRRGTTIQRAESGAVAVAKDDVEHAAKLNEMATKLHAIAGGSGQNTTRVRNSRAANS